MRHSSISGCLRGDQKTAGGYHWRKATEAEIEFLGIEEWKSIDDYK